MGRRSTPRGHRCDCHGARSRERVLRRRPDRLDGNADRRAGTPVTMQLDDSALDVAIAAGCSARAGACRRPSRRPDATSARARPLRRSAAERRRHRHAAPTALVLLRAGRRPRRRRRPPTATAPPSSPSPPPDTTPPTANAPGVAFTGAPNFVARHRRRSRSAAPTRARPPTTNSSARSAPRAATPRPPRSPAPWDTTTVADGAYVLCNVVTDAPTTPAHSTAASTVVVDNIAPPARVADACCGRVRRAARSAR